MRSTVLVIAQLLAMTMVVVSPIASAQSKVYRCGKVISDQPCYDSPVVTYVAPAKTSANGDGTVGMAACKRALLASPEWLDADSLKFEGAIVQGKWEELAWEHGKVAAPTYIARINSRNESGMYTGFKPFVCYMNGSDTKVLKIKGFN